MSRDVAIVIGTVVGGYYGNGLQGAQLGYAIGSLVGNAYDPVQVSMQGPRLNELKVQTSNYGRMIPKLYGSSRYAGNVIWSTDLIETPHTSTSGGGMFGGPEVTTTTYSYSQSFAVGLGEGPIAGIGKIWANGKLIYNMHPDASAETIQASQSIAQYMRFYAGSETQVADSLIEAHVGVGNAPAYRGTAYVVFEDLPLSSFYNRTPNLEFELMESATNSAGFTEVSGGNISSTAQSVVAFGSHYLAAIKPGTAPDGILEIYNVASPSTPQLISSLVIPNGYPGSLGQCLATNTAGTLLYLVSTYGYFFVIQAETGAAFGAGDPYSPRVTGSISGFGNNNIVSVIPNVSNPNYVYLTGWATNLLYTIYIPTKFTPAKVAQAATRTTPTRGTTTGAYLYIAHYGDGYLQIWNLANPAMPVLTGEADTGTSATAVAIGGLGGSYAILNTNGYDVWNVSNKASPTFVASFAIGGGACLFIGSTGHLFAATVNGLRVYNIIDPTNPALVAEIASETSIDSITESGGYIWGTNASSYIKAFFFSGGVTSDLLLPIDTTLGTVVSDICLRAGMTAAQIDVTALTDIVTGYVVQRSSARAQIEQLMQAFYFDAVESDGKVKFVKRGGATALTIAEDDLAAHSYGSAVPDNLVTERRQEMELPVEVNVQYMDTSIAYQVSSQRSQRLITDSSNRLAINLAISMTPSKAKQISDVLMYDAWTSRSMFTLANSWKYSYLEPTDVVNVVKTGRTYNMRLVNEDASGGIFGRGAVMEDATVYTQSAAAADPLPVTGNVPRPPLINLALMDIPLLRDQDDGIGFYAAAGKYNGTWGGCQTYKSNDGGSSWTSFSNAILNESTIGAATTALGNFLSGNIFDELNTVTVTLVSGTFSGTTELNVLNGANVLLLGSEILQFKNAALVGTNTYTLSGLLRGRFGTEWAVSTHTVGDRAVLLTSSTTYLFPSSSAEYNLVRDYKAAAFGSFLDDAIDVRFTNTGVAQECYSPVHLGGGRNAANDVLLQWVRRTRVGGAWNDYTDVPVGETTEAYVVEIYSDGTYATLKRTISGITSQSTTYTAAQQTTDGLTPGNPVYFIVYQVSATVGNGYGARGVAY